MKTGLAFLMTGFACTAEAFWCDFVPAGWLGCPPEEPGPVCPEVLPVEHLDLEQYISRSWFIQKQQVNPYQKREQLYCVVATYEEADDGFLTVNNYANNEQVNGEAVGIDGGLFSTLCAQQQSSDVQGSLKVAPCFFKWSFGSVAGPYWVIAVSPEYDWAIVSGGAPTEVRQEDPVQCTTKEGSSFLDTNGSGLWLFTRERVPSAETILAMEEELQNLGVSNLDLIDVAQEGCEYAGATLRE